MKYASMASFDSLFKAAKSGDAAAEKDLGDAYAHAVMSKPSAISPVR